jgi:hypothetical protein
VENISKFATEFDDKGLGTISVDTAPFQADPDIAGLTIYLRPMPLVPVILTSPCMWDHLARVI